MDSGWAGAVGTGIGAFIGLVGGLATTWMNSYLARPKQELAKQYLASLFESDPAAWHDVDALANMVGIQFPAIWGVLLEIGARGSVNNGRY